MPGSHLELPALRDVAVHGPYRFVRHPGFLGEALMVGACCIAAMGALGALALPGLVAVLVPRIVAEERLLSTVPDYARYRERVRFRLLPGVF